MTWREWMPYGAVGLLVVVTALTLIVYYASPTSEEAYEPCSSLYANLPNADTHTACLDASPELKESTEMTDEIRAGIVKSHNDRRAEVDPPAADMLKMSYDLELEMLARKWAETCTTPQINHDKYENRKIPGRFDYVGQNIYWGPRTHDFETAAGAWWGEKKDMDWSLAQNHTGVVGHYTQMAWASSYLVGCGGTICWATKIIVCNYGPAGNYPTLPYTNSSTRGSSCKTNNGGLCDCGTEICLNKGYLKPDCSC